MPDDNGMVETHRPRVSILIPNYNNGKESSIGGRTDLIGDLLHSLEQTLRDDPVPYEIIVCDDGSTDDSLETLRQWSSRQRPDGQPFLKLVEAEHCGVLSTVANRLNRRARGNILVRLDGDVVCLTPGWVSMLCDVFDRGPGRLGIVGPKQLAPDGTIIAFGDWVLHPNGYRHIAHGLPRHAVHHPMEVDHVMGCFYCCKKEVFEDLGDYDERILRGQTVDFGMRARLAGWRCIVVPQIEFVHAYSLRCLRHTRADSKEGIEDSLRVFEKKWGFHRVAPDLDEVRRRYQGTPLVWNLDRFAAGPMTSEACDAHLQVATSQWNGYTSNPKLKSHIDLTVQIITDMVRQVGLPQLAVHVGSGDGLVSHLLASRGLNCVGFDWRRKCIALARQQVAGHPYAGPAPKFELMPDMGHVPLADGTADLLLIVEQLERHPNPVSLLREAARVVRPGKHILVISRRQPIDRSCDPSDPALAEQPGEEHCYRWTELLNQIEAAGGWRFLIDPNKDDPAMNMIVAAERKVDEPASQRKMRVAGAA